MTLKFRYSSVITSSSFTMKKNFFPNIFIRNESTSPKNSKSYFLE